MPQRNNEDISRCFDCSVSGRCGGCSYAGLTYTEQLAQKQKTIEKLLRHKVDEIAPIVGDDSPFYYRNKVHAGFMRDPRGKIIAGTYELGSKNIVENDGCLLEDRLCRQVVDAVRDIASRYKMSIYSGKTREGLLRRVLVRRGIKTDELMAVIVLSGSIFPGKKNFIKELRERVPSLTTILFNINKRSDSMILGDTFSVEFGPGYITEVLCGKRFRISPDSFFQINTLQAETLYGIAVSLAAPGKTEKVLDAYCGTGTIGLVMSDFSKSVTGVESNRKAVADAVKNASLNKKKNIRFIAMDATEYMKGEGAEEGFDIVILDPPRSGTTAAFIKYTTQAGPEKIIYVSCNAETLARDLDRFKEYGYVAKKAVPVDMFPWTDSIETVVLIERE